MSPILFKNKALKLALFAAIRVYQKLTYRYETIPTPSQPNKIINKFSPVTNIYIVTANKDNYEKNLDLCGS
jgi:hypothetical protein